MINLLPPLCTAYNSICKFAYYQALSIPRGITTWRPVYRQLLPCLRPAGCSRLERPRLRPLQVRASATVTCGPEPLCSSPVPSESCTAVRNLLGLSSSFHSEICRPHCLSSLWDGMYGGQAPFVCDPACVTTAYMTSSAQNFYRFHVWCRGKQAPAGAERRQLEHQRRQVRYNLERASHCLQSLILFQLLRQGQCDLCCKVRVSSRTTGGRCGHLSVWLAALASHTPCCADAAPDHLLVQVPPTALAAAAATVAVRVRRLLPFKPYTRTCMLLARQHACACLSHTQGCACWWDGMIQGTIGVK